MRRALREQGDETRLKSAGSPQVDGPDTGRESRSGVANFALFNMSAPGSDPLHYFISRRWELMAPCMIVIMAMMALISGTRPAPALAFGALIAALACLCAPLLAMLEERCHYRSWKRYPLMLVAVGLPMILFGNVTAEWSRHTETVSGSLTVKGYVLIVLMATILLHRRLPSIITATVAIWLGASLHSTSWHALGLVVVCSLIGLFVAHRQAEEAEIESLRRAEYLRRQHRAEELLREYEETGQGWFWETDRAWSVTYVSPRIASLLGCPAESIVGRPFTSLFHLDVDGQENGRTLAFHLATRSSFQDLSVQAATRERGERWWSISGRPVLDQFHNFLGFRGSGIDLTEMRRSQQHVSQLAHFDSLTGLANRFQMAAWLEKILGCPKPEDRECAVLLLDLDRFKHVNDTMGHPAGDALLKEVANRLTATVGALGRVGRLGGDEFQVLLPGHQSLETLSQLARKIIESLSQPYSIEGHRVTIGASVGISLCPANGSTADEIIRNADLALYAAKGAGRGRHYFYDENLHSDARARQELENDLRDAVASGALELHYQPQVQTTSEVITGFEALLRWRHPLHGYISPARFMPVAEETGLVGSIGEWVLRRACRDLSRWPKNVRVAVNVSPLQFANPTLPEIVADAIEMSGIDAGRLELEITESVFLGDDGNVDATFAALKRVGVRLALDDFGTGYSSLGYLKKAPFDKIKIDQSFVRGATVAGSRNGAIIGSIVSLAEALGMETTAEGVETLDELELVRKLGCSHIQGFIYARPLTATAVALQFDKGLTLEAKPPEIGRAPRYPVERDVRLEHGGHHYNGTIRNVSQTGALVEGLWNVPVDTEFMVYIAEDNVMLALARWSRGDHVGIEFTQPLMLDETGCVLFAATDHAGEGAVFRAG